MAPASPNKKISKPAQSGRAEAAAEATATVPSSSSLIFERVEAEAKALPESALRAVDTDVYVVGSGTLLRMPKLMELRPRFVFHNFPLQPLDHLADYALVASDAYVAHQPEEHGAPESAVLLDASVPVLKRFKGEAMLLVLRGKAKAEEFETISERRSFRNNSEAITRYGRVLLRELPYLIDSKSTITEQEIEAGMELARRLSAIVSEREIPALNKEKQQVSDDLMTRTFTLFDLAMDSVRAGLNYILQDTPELVDAYLPRKVKKPSAAKPKKTAVDPKPKSPEDKSLEPKPDAPKQPTPSANGNIPAPTGTANGNVPSPSREEVRAAE